MVNEEDNKNNIDDRASVDEANASPLTATRKKKVVSKKTVARKKTSKKKVVSKKTVARKKTSKKKVVSENAVTRKKTSKKKVASKKAVTRKKTSKKKVVSKKAVTRKDPSKKTSDNKTAAPDVSVAASSTATEPQKPVSGQYTKFGKVSGNLNYQKIVQCVRHWVASLLKNGDMTSDETHSPPLTTIRKEGRLNIKIDFIVIALVTIFLVALLAIFSDDPAGAEESASIVGTPSRNLDTESGSGDAVSEYSADVLAGGDMPGVQQPVQGTSADENPVDNHPVTREMNQKYEL